MKKSWQLILLVFLGIALGIGGYPSAYAQEAKAEFTLEEIIVTAERRATSIMDTPLAVSALDSEALDAQGINGIVDLQMRMPSTTFISDRIYIRGIGRALTSLGSDPAVGIFYDGSYNEYLTRLDDMVDVERVETVRGPQSTMYGRNTIGGAINVIFAKPTKEFSGQVKTRIGNYDLREFTGIFSGPLIGDWLMGRVSLMDNYYGGHVKNVVSHEYQGKNDDWKVYFKLLFQPTDKFSMYFQYKVLYQFDTNEGRIEQYLENDINDPLSSTGYSPNSEYGYPNPNRGGKNPYVSQVNRVGITKLDSKEVNLATDLTLGNFTFKHYMFYRWWQNITDDDYDGTPNPDVQLIGRSLYDTHSTSQEIQVMYGGDESRISFLGGANYFRTTKHYAYDIFCQGPLYWFYSYDHPDRFYSKPEGQYYDSDTQLESESKSIYANMEFQISDKMNLSIGGRLAYEDKWTMEDATSASRAYSPPTFNAEYQADMGITDPEGELAKLDPNSETYDLDKLRLGYYLGNMIPVYYKLRDFVETKGSWDAVMWKIGSDYKWSDTSMIYFGINRGYKPGGIDISTTGGINKYDSEYLTSYEGGWKASWMKDRMQTTVSAYYYDFEDKQMSFQRGYYDEEGAWTTETITTNAAGAKNIGIEIEGAVYITQQLRADMQYSWMQAEYTDFVVWNENLKKNVNLEGNPMAMSPENKITVGATYTYPTDIGDFVLHGTYMWNDKTCFDMFADEYSWAKPWDRVDAELSWRSPDFKWRVTLWGKNITDHASIIYAAATHDTETPDPNDYTSITKYPIDPFQFGVEVSYRW